MSRFSRAAALFMGLALALAPAFAGDSKRCTWAVQDCLDYMAENLQNRGWLGIEYEIDEKTGAGVVQKVVPDSPAQAAGFRPGDILLALNDIDLTAESEEDQKAVLEAMVPGNTVTYTVGRDGKKKKLRATLAPLNRELLAQWIGRHMIEHFEPVEAAREHAGDHDHEDDG